MNEFKWQCLTNQMRAIWSFEKYTIESTATCGDQQQVKHELTSEKAYLNKIELAKLQSMLSELRLNLIKSGLVSSQFCSKLARVKLESYIHDFLIRIRNFDYKKPDQIMKFVAVNSELKMLIDILFYFNRKHAKPSTKILTGLSESGKKSVKKSSAQSDNIYSEIDDNNSNGDASDVPQTSSKSNNDSQANKKSQDNSNESKNYTFFCLLLIRLLFAVLFPKKQLKKKTKKFAAIFFRIKTWLKQVITISNCG